MPNAKPAHLAADCTFLAGPANQALRGAAIGTGSCVGVADSAWNVVTHRVDDQATRNGITCVPAASVSAVAAILNFHRRAVAQLRVARPVDPAQIRADIETAAIGIRFAARATGRDADIRVAGTALLATVAPGDTSTGRTDFARIAVAGIEALDARTGFSLAKQSISNAAIDAGTFPVALAAWNRIACNARI